MGSGRKKPGKKQQRSSTEDNTCTNAKKAKSARELLVDAADALASPPTVQQNKDTKSCSKSDVASPDSIPKLDISEEAELDPETPAWAVTLIKTVNDFRDEVRSGSLTVANVQTAVTSIIKSNLELADSAEKMASQVESLEREQVALRNENSLLQEKLLLLEFHQRRNNLIFDGIPEAVGFESGRDCYDKIVDCISGVPGIFPDVRIDRCHRLGPKQKFGNRSIIARFNWYGDVTAILGNKPSLQRDVFVSEDFLDEWVNRRRLLRPLWYKAKSILKFRDGTFLTRDKLIIDGKQYTVAPKNNLNELPKEINPAETCEQRDEKTIAFLGPHSVFSNFHPSPFTDNSVKYSCAEQMIQAEKAALFKDKVSLEQIMLEKDPYRIKSLGNRVRNFDKEVWSRNSKSIVRRAVGAKFSQNSCLGNLIKCTGTLLIVEASPDRYWGTGQHLRSKSALNRETWVSHGAMSEILAEVRSSLKSTS